MEVLTHTQGSETRLLGLDGAAIYLNITPRSIYRLIDRGIIRPVRIPGVRRTLFDKHDLDTLVESGKLKRASAVGEETMPVGATE